MHRDDKTELPSKSQRKREAQAVQQLVGQLIALPEGSFRDAPLDPERRADLTLARRLHPHSSARKRQLRYIARRLPETTDLEAVRAFLADQDQAHRGTTARHRQAESWRERLLAEGEPALDALCALPGPWDRTPLRRLLRAARQEQAQGGRPRYQRQLFRALRDGFAQTAIDRQRTGDETGDD